MERHLKLKKRSEYLKFLDALSKISDSSIIDITNEKITSLVSSADNTLILYSELITESDFHTTINVPDIKKLYRVLDALSEEDLKLKINSNNIEYKGTSVKFKYHLFENGFLNKPNLNIDKINAFKFDVNFELTVDQLRQILRGSTFASETNKLYLYTEDNKLIAELTDRARHNTDSFSICLGDVDFTLKPTPINFDNVRLLTNISSTFNVRINTEYDVVLFENQADNIKLKYIISSLTQ